MEKEYVGIKVAEIQSLAKDLYICFCSKLRSMWKDNPEMIMILYPVDTPWAPNFVGKIKEINRHENVVYLTNEKGKNAYFYINEADMLSIKDWYGNISMRVHDIHY